ncbi:predicted protein [Naegleria gruberi]|uniref:Predicted protein n=1 Tax=Naegleria gruberi TaxID=5762 RepID=D2W222_NAEGR|nr:uncharacterized protein NAEGRDRAFT_75432 [Naegleria gruberi]EFC36866.1 predicted protein [Naegleria gruberi]|eukprot:XP_002669610.1 predicted protein [Naegleria gruberi strain NEG-M]
MELTLLTFNLIFGTSLIILYLVGLVAWKYYDKKQRLFRKDILKRVSRHVNSTRKGEHHVSQHEPLESSPPIVIFPLSRQEIYPYEKQETFPSQTHTPSSHRIRRSSIDCTHLHQSLHSSTSLHYDHHKWIKIMWDLYELLPPVPYLSVLIQYLSDPVVFVERCAKIYGPCFSIYAWFGIKWTFMVGPDSNRIFFSDIEGKQSNLFNPLIDYSKASEMLNKAFERSDILPRNHQICLPFISRRVRWHPLENEPELKEEPISKKQLLTEKEHLKQMLHEGFSSIQPLSEFVLENIRKEVKSSLFHLNHINLDFVDKNEMPAIAEADLETPKQLFGITKTFSPKV